MEILPKHPPTPLKGGMVCGLIISVCYENFGLSSFFDGLVTSEKNMSLRVRQSAKGLWRIGG